MARAQHSRHILDGEERAEARGLPVYTIAQIADYEVNGYWQSTGSSSHSWASDHSPITYNLDAIDAGRRSLAKLALASWAELTGLTFKATSGAADITFTETGSRTAVTNTTYFGHSLVSAVVDISADWSNTAKMDTYLMQTFVHEIGHALGLGHTGPYNVSAEYGVDNIFANDTEQYSVMSYMQQHNYGGASDRFVMTPQMADIFAIQDIYSAGTARAGNTTYGFHASGQEKATAAIYNFNNYNEAPALTIYDSGGKDTLDFSGYSQRQTIDLVGGTWSDIGGLKGNIGIYQTSVTEKAIGGSGHDRIIGNNVANVLNGNRGDDSLSGGKGNDTLIGGKGDDILTGGLKNDTFVFQAGWDNDTIKDFKSGADKIDLSKFHFDNINDVKSIAEPSHSSDDLVLDFGHGDTLTIDHFSKAEISFKDFIL